eukprot:8071651-Ditylum_brightwellii.AAC.1
MLAGADVGGVHVDPTLFEVEDYAVERSLSPVVRDILLEILPFMWKISPNSDALHALSCQAIPFFKCCGRKAGDDEREKRGKFFVWFDIFTSTYAKVGGFLSRNGVFWEECDAVESPLSPLLFGLEDIIFC